MLTSIPYLLFIIPLSFFASWESKKKTDLVRPQALRCVDAGSVGSSVEGAENIQNPKTELWECIHQFHFSNRRNDWERERFPLLPMPIHLWWGNEIECTSWGSNEFEIIEW